MNCVNNLLYVAEAGNQRVNEAKHSRHFLPRPLLFAFKFPRLSVSFGGGGVEVVRGAPLLVASPISPFLAAYSMSQADTLGLVTQAPCSRFIGPQPVRDVR